MSGRVLAYLAVLLGSLSLAVPAAWAAPTFSATSIEPVVFATSPHARCHTQPTNSVTLPAATGTGTISYAIANLPTGVTLSGNTLTGDTATIMAQDATTYTYTATDDGDSQTASLTFTLEIEDERAVLEAFYTATGGDTWTKQTDTNTGNDWPNKGADPYTIPGDSINCLSELSGVRTWKGRVYSLTFPDNNLTGTIPSEVGKLTSLDSISLENNKLTGTIPDFSGLTNLDSLELENNELTGDIPALDGLTSLYTFNLSGNELTGDIPDLSKLTSLETLNLSGNKLNNMIPDFSNLEYLETLDLSGNQLAGAIPNFSALDSLETLYLHNNKLSGEIPDIYVVELSLYGNPDLYGYPDSWGGSRLFSPGDGSAVCLPTTQGGSDCTVPTLVDNLRRSALTPTHLTLTWEPKPAGDNDSYSAEYCPSGEDCGSWSWTELEVSGTTATIPRTASLFRVQKENDDYIPWLAVHVPQLLVPVAELRLSTSTVSEDSSETITVTAHLNSASSALTTVLVSAPSDDVTLSTNRTLTIAVGANS